MRRTTTRNTATRIAKNGPARGKYCIWPMVILKLQGGGKNRLHGRTTRTCQAGSAFAERPCPTLLYKRRRYFDLPSPHAVEVEWGASLPGQRRKPGLRVGNRSLKAAFALLWRI